MDSLRTSSIAKLITPDDNKDYSSFASLHRVAWGRRDLRTIFHDRVVQRDWHHPPLTAKVLSWAHGTRETDDLFKPFNVSSILVRNEYVGLLLDILRDALVAPPKQVDSDGDDDMDVEHDVGLKDELLDYLARTVPHGVPYAIVTGTPGIGKSMFLFFVLALRVLAGLPTIFQMHEDRICAITHEGAFQIDYPLGDKSLRRYIAKGAWVLVDSGDVAAIPQELVALCINLNGYLIQAASPRRERVQWAKKVFKRPRRYWTALWTLEELIQARDLQVWGPGTQRPSEQDMRDFCKLFGGSARSVYGYATGRAEFEKMVLEEIATITLEKLRTMLNNYQALVVDNEITHSIVMAEPEPSNRRKLTMKIASNYLTDLILDHVRASDQQAVSHLYWLFITNPHTRSHAGYLLERLVLESFPKGGQWEMTVIEKSRPGDKNTRWHIRPNAPHRFLCLGGRQHCLDIADRLQVGQFLPILHYKHPTNDQITLSDGFYDPVPGTQPMFDALAYDAARSWVTSFQMTVSSSHSISTVDLDRLTALGAKTIDLVVITDPKEKMDLYVANSDNDRIRHVYHLILQGEGW